MTSRTLGAQIIGRLDDPRVRESSGLTASIGTYPGFGAGVLWTHNDSGGIPAIYAIDPATAKVVREVKIPGASATDWEAIGAGRSADGTPVIYIGDVGNNSRSRSKATLWRVNEPQRLDGRAADGLKRIDLTYPGGARLDCEAILVDRSVVAGRFWLLSKEAGRPGGIFAAPYGGGAMHRIGNVREWVTDAALSPAGDLMVLRSGDYGSAYRWPFDESSRWDFKWPKQAQGEGMCFSRSGNSIFLSSEGREHLLKVETSAVLKLAPR